MDMQHRSGGVVPVDAVITWVDGDDVSHKEERRKYASADELDNDDVGGDVRYKSVGEIFYCVASILRFAPFVRKIFIVTDGQNPHLEDFVEKNFPDRSTEIEIVDHKVIFEGYESYLPVFNSLAIESMLWRIPGISERFIYFNDDVLLSRPTVVEDFFVGDSLVCYASRMSWHFAAFLRWVKHLGRSHKIFGFKDAMINAADILGIHGTFLHLSHTPHMLLRDVMKEYYAAYPHALVANIKHRFRDSSQYNPQELCYLLADTHGRAVVRSPKGVSMFIHPRRKKNYIDGKIKELDSMPDAKFLCINSICGAEPQDVRKILTWIENRLDLSL